MATKVDKLDEIRARIKERERYLEHPWSPSINFEESMADNAELLRMVEEQTRINDALLKVDEQECERCEESIKLRNRIDRAVGILKLFEDIEGENWKDNYCYVHRNVKDSLLNILTGKEGE